MVVFSENNLSNIFILLFKCGRSGPFDRTFEKKMLRHKVIIRKYKIKLPTP